MRIAILGSRGYPSTYGGFETLVRYLGTHLRASGHEVTVYGRSDESSWRFHDHNVDGIEVIITPGLSSTSFSTLSYGLTSSLHCARRLRPDVVIAVNVAMGLYLPLLRRHGIPTILNVDGIEWERAKWGRVARRVFLLGAKSAAQQATHLVADSRAIGDHWAHMFGRRPEFIPYGGEAPHAVDSSVLEDNSLSAGQYVLFVARLVPENSVELFMSAVRLISSRLPIVIVGSASEGDPMRMLVEEAAKAGEVHWLGHVSDQQRLHALWRNAAVYFHGHTAGGTNPALLQAMANACPVVALDTPYSREVLGDEYRLCSSDASAIAEALTAVSEDDDLRARLSAEVLRRVSANYVWRDVCAAYERLAMSAGRI